LEPHSLTIVEASRLIRGGKLSPVDLLESILQRIEDLEPKVEAWVTLDPHGARAAAEKMADEAGQGKIRGPLHGIPVGLKDIYNTAGLRTTMGSQLYVSHVPDGDAEVVKRLREAGAVVVGKTETTEFAYLDPAPTRNPWNLGHTPGGSSSGSAAAVSSLMVPLAFGSQTGGSTIRPASYCGVVGVKPTYDLISREGIFPLAWSLDHVGLFTRTVEDAALALDVVAGTQTSRVLKAPPPRVGVPKEFYVRVAHDEVKQGFDAAMRRLEGRGAEVVEMKLPASFKAVHDAHRIIMAVEAAAVHEKSFKQKMAGYRQNIRGYVASGLLVPATSYLQAQRVRRRFTGEMLAAMEGLDCVLTPSTTSPAPQGLSSTGDAAFNSPWSLTGFPTITVPSGLSSLRLPLGVQLTAPPFEEARLMGVARWCESVLGPIGSPEMQVEQGA